MPDYCLNLGRCPTKTLPSSLAADHIKLSIFWLEPRHCPEYAFRGHNRKSNRKTRASATIGPLVNRRDPGPDSWGITGAQKYEVPAAQGPSQVCPDSCVSFLFYFILFSFFPGIPRMGTRLLPFCIMYPFPNSFRTHSSAH